MTECYTQDKVVWEKTGIGEQVVVPDNFNEDVRNRGTEDSTVLRLAAPIGIGTGCSVLIGRCRGLVETPLPDSRDRVAAMLRFEKALRAVVTLRETNPQPYTLNPQPEKAAFGLRHAAAESCGYEKRFPNHFVTSIKEE